MFFYNCNRGCCQNGSNSVAAVNGVSSGVTALAAVNGSSAGATVNNNPNNVRALVDCIIDNCRATEQFSQKYTLSDVPYQPEACTDELRIGVTYPVQQCGPLSMEIINRTADVTTVMYSIPIALMYCNGCAYVPFLRTVVTAVRNYCLQGNARSSFRLLDSQVQSLTAAVTGIDNNNDTAEITVSASVDVHVGEIEERELCLRSCDLTPAPTCASCRTGSVNNGNSGSTVVR